MKDGSRVLVDLGTGQLDREYKRHLIELAKKAGRYAKKLGLLDDGNISVLWG